MGGQKSRVPATISWPADIYGQERRKLKYISGTKVGCRCVCPEWVKTSIRLAATEYKADSGSFNAEARNSGDNGIGGRADGLYRTLTGWLKIKMADAIDQCMFLGFTYNRQFKMAPNSYMGLAKPWARCLMAAAEDARQRNILDDPFAVRIGGPMRASFC